MALGLFWGGGSRMGWDVWSRERARRGTRSGGGGMVEEAAAAERRGVRLEGQLPPKIEAYTPKVPCLAPGYL